MRRIQSLVLKPRAVSLFEEHKPKDYQLECLVEDKHYFIKSPMYIVLGEPRDQDDHI